MRHSLFMYKYISIIIYVYIYKYIHIYIYISNLFCVCFSAHLILKKHLLIVMLNSAVACITVKNDLRYLSCIYYIYEVVTWYAPLNLKYSYRSRSNLYLIVHNYSFNNTLSLIRLYVDGWSFLRPSSGTVTAC